MGIYTKRSIFHLFSFSSAVLLLMFLSSCVKSPDDLNTAIPSASIMFIQASPDEPPVDLYFNQTKYGGSFFSYGSYSGYFKAITGVSHVNVISDVDGKTVLADSVTLSNNGIYSLFLANKATQPEFVLLTDTSTTPLAGNANIRFINLSPDAPAVDLVVNAGATLVTNKPYKGYSSFSPIGGNTTYTLEVHQAGTATVLATLSNFKIMSGNNYTVWFHGLVANTSTSDQLAVNIIDNY